MLNELPLPTHPDYGMRPLPATAYARAKWAEVRADHGLSGDGSVPLLGAPDSNQKIDKNEVPTYSLTLAPARTSGHNVCERSTPQCRKACVMWTAGRGVFASVRKARQAKTDFLATHPYLFLRLLHDEIRQACVRHADGQVAFRLNTASDIRWERFPWLFEFENAEFYDYTKWHDDDRFPLPVNYRLTYSHNEQWLDGDVKDYTMAGHNVAMVFDVPKHQLPKTWQGRTVIDGDVDDYRYGDPQGVIVGLAAKGAAKQLEAGGFVSHVTIN